MPIKIDEMRNINTQHRSRIQLFKRNRVQKQQPTMLHGDSLIQEGHFNPVHKLVLKVLDAINPIAYKHPKIGAGLMTISEKIIKRSDSFR